MGRNPCCSKGGLSKGAWTAMEDKILKEYIKIHGEGKWKHVPKRAGLKRCGKSCRLRWLNYLRPGIKRGNITNDEEDLIIRLHNLLGNRWSIIAGRLPGRTDNEIKNYWNTNIRRKLENGIIPCCSTKSAEPCLSNSVQKEHYSNPTNKGLCMVHTKGTKLTQVTVTKDIAQQNEGIKTNDNKMKGPSLSSERDNNELWDFMDDFEIDDNFFSELLKMDLPKSSLESKIMEENRNRSIVDLGQFSVKSSTDEAQFLWGDSVYDTDSDLQLMETLQEIGFDRL
ncbi:hypothetical protein TanjilG_20198 [Lupinus angustifolius]|uniref:Uncharacterized protein n=1 Tax=Lupinus angustifolius TaxID=3871 RepID=A0A1J7IWA1_LUPAN|nr:PREDICTED: transcription factor WER-like [Lupinus angustifolius]OIW17094.1 hypothetical protein TanjilG_20198 [Lupinus angustifolius]